MTTDREKILLSILNEGISEAWDFYPLSPRAKELQGLFRKCKEAITELSQIGSETGIDRIAYICRECIRDGFGTSTGIRDHALKLYLIVNTLTLCSIRV
jgi:hypothetical protein